MQHTAAEANRTFNTLLAHKTINILEYIYIYIVVLAVQYTLVVYKMYYARMQLNNLINGK